MLDFIFRPPSRAQRPASRMAISQCDAWFGPESLAHWTAPTAPPVPIHLHPHALLAREGAPATSLFIVQRGDFKVSRTAEDGYEQVLGFAADGDVLGLEAIAERRSATNLESLEEAIVYAVALGDVASLRRSNPTFDARLQQALSAQWQRVVDIAWLMAAVGADRRTARFLLQVSRRMAERGQSPSQLRLRMRRRDIAAHLGLAHESISRAMTALSAAGFIEVHCRDIRIVDREGLQRFASTTRGHAEETGSSRAARHPPAAARGRAAPVAVERQPEDALSSA